ncbi:hypothetical protein [Tumebacillus sp. BK434]|uniref:hypothetical protein n=1 Tax=Tumebacillus sp. BK434 TaxID=2512169 RepID=UPI00104FD000|nr:hypothetical protein [Tumebacillus sp. BK434]
MNWRFLLITSGVLGILAGLVPVFLGDQYLFTTLPIAMMFSSFFIVPRIKDRKLPSAILVTMLTALISLVVFFIYQYATLDSAVATANLKTAMVNLPLTILIISLAGSWVFVKTNEWTEKKRKEVEAKMAAKNGDKSKDNGTGKLSAAAKLREARGQKAYVPHATKKRYRNTKKKK